MSDSQAIPELTAEHKTSILLAQRQILTTQADINNSIKKLEQATKALQDLINSIATELKVTDELAFDLNELILVPKR